MLIVGKFVLFAEFSFANFRKTAHRAAGSGLALVYAAVKYREVAHFARIAVVDIAEGEGVFGLKVARYLVLVLMRHDHSQACKFQFFDRLHTRPIRHLERSEAANNAYIRPPVQSQRQENRLKRHGMTVFAFADQAKHINRGVFAGGVKQRLDRVFVVAMKKFEKIAVFHLASQKATGARSRKAKGIIIISLDPEDECIFENISDVGGFDG